MRLHLRLMNTSSLVNRTVPVMLPPAEADDHDLMVRVAGHDEVAFAELVRRYQVRVAGLARRLLGYGDGAEDVVQEVFLAAYEKAGRFRAEASVWTWLARITVNRTRTLRRRRWLKERVLRLVNASTTGLAGPSDWHSIQEERAAKVRQAVACLPSKYREVVVLRYLEGLTIPQVCSIVGASRNIVDVRLTRARKQLEEVLDELREDL